jgi:hypothetical protein
MHMHPVACLRPGHHLPFQQSLHTAHAGEVQCDGTIAYEHWQGVKTSKGKVEGKRGSSHSSSGLAGVVHAGPESSSSSRAHVRSCCSAQARARATGVRAPGHGLQFPSQAPPSLLASLPLLVQWSALLHHDCYGCAPHSQQPRNEIQRAWQHQFLKRTQQQVRDGAPAGAPAACSKGAGAAARRSASSAFRKLAGAAGAPESASSGGALHARAPVQTLAGIPWAPAWLSPAYMMHASCSVPHIIGACATHRAAWCCAAPGRAQLGR